MRKFSDLAMGIMLLGLMLVGTYVDGLGAKR